MAFLPARGVPPQYLLHALHEGAYLRERPEHVLLASGRIQEVTYYRALARHLGLPFLERLPDLHPSASYPQTLQAGVAPAAAGGPADKKVANWIFAPQDQRLDELLLLNRKGNLPRDRFSITTPTCLAAGLMRQRGHDIAHNAAEGLTDQIGACFSARHWTSWKAASILSALTLVFGGAWMTGGTPWLLVCLFTGLMLGGFTSLRLLAAAASCDPPPRPQRASLSSPDLPMYSIIVPLYREALSVRPLTAALGRLDYPASRLDVIFVVESDDDETHAALTALQLPAQYHVLVAPPGEPRTKPRALNIALPIVRGAYVCVFDAEDIPEPGQLREAAERFAALPAKVACLQGRLLIDNGADGWLARCFAFEYAALFDVINPGLAALGAPLPLGGTSNHFRALMAETKVHPTIHPTVFERLSFSSSKNTVG